MNPLDFAFDSLRKSHAPHRRKKKRKKDEAANIPALPGKGWRRIEDLFGGVPPGKDPRNYAGGFFTEQDPDSPTFEIGSEIHSGKDHVARRKAGPLEGHNTDIYEYDPVTGEWVPTKPEIAEKRAKVGGATYSEPTGRRMLTGVKRRSDDRAKMKELAETEHLGSDAHQAGMAALQPLIDAHSSTPPQLALPAPTAEPPKQGIASRFTNVLSKPLRDAYTRFLKPDDGKDSEQVPAE